jgi:hypothetical protein
MAMPEELPAPVAELMRSSSVGQYVTISAAGVPIDTPVLFFPSEGLRSFDLATGLSDPAKAGRARRNPRTALLIEGAPDEPVISIAGMAAVRDADLQANVARYLSEAAHTLPHNPDWDLARQAVWYWTRMIVEITPARVLWWDSPAAMDRPPQRWDAPAGTVYPPSDPVPPGAVSAPAKWEQPPWRELAGRALARGGTGHLSLIDAEGFPVSVRVRSVASADEGLALDLPKGMPCAVAGKACLTFGGIETFIGEMTEGGFLRVERTLPVFPMTSDMTQLWEPAAHTRSELMKRLLHETQRRGQPIPTIPAERPEPTEGYRRRMARFGKGG